MVRRQHRSPSSHFFLITPFRSFSYVIFAMCFLICRFFGQNSLALGDIDRDGLPDLAYTCARGSRSISIARNLGKGAFSQPAYMQPLPFDSSTSVEEILLDWSDLDGDGFLELHVGAPFSQISSYQLNVTDGNAFHYGAVRFLPPVSLGSTAMLSYMSSDDLNGPSGLISQKGTPILWTAQGSLGTAITLKNQTTFVAPHSSALYRVQAARLLTLAYPSLNQTQVVVAGKDFFGYLNVDLSGVEPQFSPGSLLDSLSFDFSLADMNNDGLVDIVYLSRMASSSEITLTVSLNSGYGFHDSYTRLLDIYSSSLQPEAFPAKVSTGDINNDRFPDIVILSHDGKLSLMLNTQGTFSDMCLIQQLYSGVLDGHPDQLRVVDMNGDNKADIIVMGNSELLLSFVASIEFEPVPSLYIPAYPTTQSSGKSSGFWSVIESVPRIVLWIPILILGLLIRVCYRSCQRNEDTNVPVVLANNNLVVDANDVGPQGYVPIYASAGQFASDSESGDGDDEEEGKPGEEIPSGEECVVCLDKRISMVFLECGHMACCYRCAKKLTTCPLCREKIVAVVRVAREQPDTIQMEDMTEKSQQIDEAESAASLVSSGDSEPDHV